MDGRVMGFFANRAERRRLKRTKPKSEGPVSPLMVKLVPMTIADMAKGFRYEPGMSILKVSTFPIFGKDGNESYSLTVPVKLPPERRKLSPENALFAIDLVKSSYPEAAAKIATIEAVARSPQSLAIAKALELLNVSV